MRLFVSRRRPELMLFAALLVLAAAFVSNTFTNGTQTNLAFDTSTPAPAPVELGDESTIARLQSRIRRNPDDTEAYALLGHGLLQQVRETGDVSLYAQAGHAFDAALKRDPQQVDALLGRGALALSRHQFQEALAWGERARDVNPYRAQVYGIISDAQIELGQYEAATESVQQMIDTRPDLSSYSRVSYVRELYGDTQGAIEAMELAVSAGGPATENTLWTQVQLGHLHFNNGDLAQAEITYRKAIAVRADYPYALAGIARVDAAQGRYDEAIEAYRQISERLPLPEFVIALGELYEATDRPTDAKAQYDLVRVMQQLNAGAGVDVDLELALFDAEHGAEPVKALERARATYERRPSIYAADALAWALHKNGQHDEARRYSEESLRLGTRDATLHYRAAMIANALGDTEAAQQHARQALEINPFFSVRHAPELRALVDDTMTR
jgi:tetratricopeptide (TPR) repeat protein